MSSRVTSLTLTYFLSTYLMLIMLDSVGGHRNEQAKAPVLKEFSVDAQDVSNGWVVVSHKRFSLL